MMVEKRLENYFFEAWRHIEMFEEARGAIKVPIVDLKQH